MRYIVAHSVFIDADATNETLPTASDQSLFTNVHDAFTMEGTVSGTALFNNQAEIGPQ
jgi:hypothetical protein